MYNVIAHVLHRAADVVIELEEDDNVLIVELIRFG